MPILIANSYLWQLTIKRETVYPNKIIYETNDKKINIIGYLINYYEIDIIL